LHITHLGYEAGACRLIAHAERHSLDPFLAVGLGIRGEALVARGEVGRGIDLLRDSLARQRADRYELYTAEISCAYAATLAAAGYLDHALETIMEIISAVASRGGSFMMPEMLRLRGEFLAQAGDRRGAEDCFQQSIVLADQQCALSWRLRTATSLAWLQDGRGDRNVARSELALTYAQFHEGHGTADLRSAKLLLDKFGQVSLP
jgi:predicted ATPase